jgi:hypothetical protein
VRAAAGIKPGSDVVLEACDGEVRIRSVAAAVTRVQEKYKRLARGRNVVDELLVERREAATRESNVPAAIDAPALRALVFGESLVVARDAFENAILSTVNLAEALPKMVDVGAAADDAMADVEALGLARFR